MLSVAFLVASHTGPDQPNTYRNSMNPSQLGDKLFSNCGRCITAVVFVLAATLLSNCAIFEDNGTRMAFTLERGANELAASRDTELVLEYMPTTGIEQGYEVRFSPSKSTEVPYGGYVVVTGKNGGGTNYHTRSVYVAKAFHLTKMNASTRITLKKVGGRIEVVDLQ